MTSFFGGDPNVSHFSVGVRYKAHKDETTKEQSERRKAERETLKAHGFKTETYYQYRNSDKRGKALAKVNADKLAARIEKACGVKMDVCEGFFL